MGWGELSPLGLGSPKRVWASWGRDGAQWLPRSARTQWVPAGMEVPEMGYAAARTQFAPKHPTILAPNLQMRRSYELSGHRSPHRVPMAQTPKRTFLFLPYFGLFCPKLQNSPKGRPEDAHIGAEEAPK